MAIQIPPIVAVDSMTLVWGLRREGPQQECLNAQWLFSQFTARQTQVIVSTVALSEYLTAIDPTLHEAVVEKMEERFIFYPFTKDCASLAAALFQTGQQMRNKNVPGARATLRADAMIVASAKVHGAGCIFSHDRDCRDLANTITQDFGRDLPEAEVNLYGDPIED
jgi:hypothetical protein